MRGVKEKWLLHFICTGHVNIIDALLTIGINELINLLY